MNAVRHVEQVMGLPVSVDVRRCDHDPVPVIRRAFDWLRDVDAWFSPFRTDSEVSRLDRGELALDELSADMTEVLALCADYERRSGGAFRARLPGYGLDPSGVVKGWAVQRMADLLIADGVRQLCVNAGGDVLTMGEAEPGRPWRVGVRHPERADRMCVVFEVGDAAVATSGGYERGAHILDGRTGAPATELLSLTVLADDLTTADATATAGFALGAEGVAWAADQPGCLVFAIDADHRVHRSAGLDELIRPAAATADQPPA
ncbi:MAG TPA: FAD:protein FMN transferase [Pseudonocardiaceae bacterium]|nr:FAD:protein FMN transferase [Pseudonocardiaceae bacterium]